MENEANNQIATYIYGIIYMEMNGRGQTSCALPSDVTEVERRT